MAEQLMRVLHVWEVWSSNLGQAKSNTALQTVCHRYSKYASSCIALVLWCGVGHCKLITRFSIIRQL